MPEEFRLAIAHGELFLELSEENAKKCVNRRIFSRLFSRCENCRAIESHERKVK